MRSCDRRGLAATRRARCSSPAVKSTKHGEAARSLLASRVVKSMLSLRLDLGVRRLLPEWRALFSREHLQVDLMAGITVAFIALPLSLAIALASGVAPAVGLITAIVAGIVCALFGGTPLGVSGPAAAMAVLIAGAIQTHGIGGLMIIGLLCGVLQLLTGVLGLGRIIRLVPLPVVEGFTAGIGAIILIGQLPRVLGLPPPDQSHVIDVITHIGELVHQAKPAAVLIALGTLALVIGLPRIHKRIPGALIGIAVPTALVAILGLEVETIGAIPRTLSLPGFPTLPTGAAWWPILSTALVVFAIASLESLLSSSAVDKLAPGNRHDPDQELIGQGLGNLASALVGGIPVTGVIARSALNAQAGGKTRRPAIIHALVLLVSVFLLAPVLGKIPVAALAGVLFSVALRMLDPRKLVALYRVSRPDAIIYGVTLVVIVFADLLEGVQWGIVVALAVAAIRLGQTGLNELHIGGTEPSRLAPRGPLTFMSSLQIEVLRERVANIAPGDRVTLDLSGVTAIDATGAELIVDLVGAMKERELRVAVLGLAPDLTRSLLAADHPGIIAPALAMTEADVKRVQSARAPLSARQRLVLGVERYRRDQLPRYVELYKKLAPKQHPHTLFITCADSRIQPALIISTDPGDLFIVRDIGNMVPPFVAERPPSAGASLEYAVGVIGVSEVVLCAHSRCGAIYALRHPEQVPAGFTSLDAWLSETNARTLCERLPKGVADDDVARLNALLQLDHVRTYPLVRERLLAGTLRVHVWFFDVATGDVEEWDPALETWRSLGAGEVSLPPTGAAPRPEARPDPSSAGAAIAGA
jgi:carbonic anhydrase